MRRPERDPLRTWGTGFVAFMVVCALVAVGFVVLVFWAVIKVVNHFT